jgi:peroxidase
MLFVPCQTNGPSFQVPTGRRDGLSSNLRDADVLPDVSDSIQVLRNKFAASGLNDRDLVLLTGTSASKHPSLARIHVTRLTTCIHPRAAAHTIGTTACFFVKDRLYGYRGGAGSDPSIPAPFLSELKSRCAPGDFNTRLPLDRGSEFSFDDNIYRNIRAGLVPIASDAALDASNATAGLVASYLGAAAPSFAQDFVGAMVKMGTIGAITGDAGEIRDVCWSFNSN